MSGPPTASTSGRPAASGRMRSASSITTFANSTWRMIGCARSQSMMVGRSIRPRTSRGTSGGTVLTNTNRPCPARGGVTESRMTTSASPMPPWYCSGVLTSNDTCGSVLRTFSRKRFPALTRRTSIFRGGGSTAYATLSAARSSSILRRAVTVPPPPWLNGNTTERRTAGSSLTSFSASVWPSTSSPNVNVCGSDV